MIIVADVARGAFFYFCFVFCFLPFSVRCCLYGLFSFFFVSCSEMHEDHPEPP